MEQAGATAVEYAVLASLIAAVVVAVVVAVGSKTHRLYECTEKPLMDGVETCT